MIGLRMDACLRTGGSGVFMEDSWTSMASIRTIVHGYLFYHFTFISSFNMGVYLLCYGLDRWATYTFGIS